jgi:hypothetical protein
MACSSLTVDERRAAPPTFIEHTLATGLTGGYQVLAVDLNRDGKLDVLALASDLHELSWLENPTWTSHVLARDLESPINAAACDVDGDGIPEIALAQGFEIEPPKSAGIVSILTHGSDPTAPWSVREIDRLPTSHRLRFLDLDGSGMKVLVNAPLVGLESVAPEFRDHVSIVMYRPGEWKRESITADERGVVHGILADPFPKNDSNSSACGKESLLSASFEGVHVHRFENGRWTRTKLVDGDPADWPKCGASEIAVGRLGDERFLTTIEPWHGNQVVVYRASESNSTGAKGTTWTRRVIDASLEDGHALAVGDFDGDGSDEIVAGERGGKRAVRLYRFERGDPERESWTASVLSVGSGAAGCAVADLNGDGRLDVVTISSATGSVSWFENRN